MLALRYHGLVISIWVSTFFTLAYLIFFQFLRLQNCYFSSQWERESAGRIVFQLDSRFDHDQTGRRSGRDSRRQVFAHFDAASGALFDFETEATARLHNLIPHHKCTHRRQRIQTKIKICQKFLTLFIFEPFLFFPILF